jgi:glycosyltransferase involved in cell wall biosynthesis
VGKKNIVLVIEALSGGGAELVVANLCRSMDKRLFEVSVCCLSEIGHRGKELVADGHPVDVLSGTRRIDKYLKWRGLAAVARRRRAHLIHSHSAGSLFDSGMAAKLSSGLKHVHTFHFGNYPHVPGRTLLLEKAFSRLPDRLVAVGKEQAGTISRVFRLPAQKIEVIWNGIEIDKKHSRPPGGAPAPVSGGKVILCSISTLIEQKGLSYLLDAIALLGARRRDFELRIIGDGPLRSELTAKATALGLDDVVKFEGWVYNAPETVLPHIDVFVQSSLWEAMSMAVLEAMAASKPSVVTDVGDNAHVIRHGIDGLIVPKLDVERMAQGLERVIADEQFRQRIGQQARQRVCEQCTVEVMARSYERLYQSVLGN